MTEWLHFHFSLSCIGEGNGNPLQCSCLENPRDREAWWAAVYGVAQTRTRLTQLSSSSSSRLLCQYMEKNMILCTEEIYFLKPGRIAVGWGWKEKWNCVTGGQASVRSVLLLCSADHVPGTLLTAFCLPIYSMRETWIIFPFYRWGDWSSMKLNNVPKIT